jgi:hypothetical protein
MTVLAGGCHCRKIRFEFDAPDDIVVSECNCSICRMLGFLHLIVPRSDFRLLQGADDLTTYTFNTGIAQHYFCRCCGIKSFYVPRSHPNGISVNARCLDDIGVIDMKIESFDGLNWEAAREKMSRETSR